MRMETILIGAKKGLFSMKCIQTNKNNGRKNF